MKKIKLFLVGVSLLSFYFISSAWFQAVFFTDNFYKNIASEPFDVTTEGETVTLPIHNYTFPTCYDLSIAVPGSKFFHDGLVGNGCLAYSFESNGRVIYEGITNQLSGRHRNLYKNNSSISLLVFDLPFIGASHDLVLRLTVLEPMTFLNNYRGSITAQVNPDYSPKRSGCYNEELKIHR